MLHGLEGPFLQPRRPLRSVPPHVPGRPRRLPRLAGPSPRPRLGLCHRQRAGSPRADAALRAVVATDASPQQITHARPHPKVTYLVAPAERTPLKDASVDLVTVALALHWFDHDRFYADVRRVVRPSGILACWTYHLQTVSPEVDAVVRRLYADILGPYWPPQVRHIEDGYRSLPFPFEEFTPPPFQLVQEWDMNRLAAYMGT